MSEARARWQAFVDEAPELARAVQNRFVANLHHVIGTIRADGAPRLSGTEVQVEVTGVTVGMMPGSRKLADARRDARVEIHSAPLEDDLAEGDAKLIGRLIERKDGLPEDPDAGHFELLVERVVLIRVDGDQLVIATWDQAHGHKEQRRR